MTPNFEEVPQVKTSGHQILIDIMCQSGGILSFSDNLTHKNNIQCFISQKQHVKSSFDELV